MESNRLSIRNALLPEELHLIESFRYQVYVEDLGIHQRRADHRSKTVPDPLDRSGHHFVAMEDGKIRGLLRLNFARDSDLIEFETLFQMNRAGADHPQKTSIMSSFLVAKEHRSTLLSFRLIEVSFRLMYQSGIEHLFFCGSELYTDFYERLGAYRSDEMIQHPDQGPAFVFYSRITDLERFREKRSPLVRVANEYRQGGFTVTTISPSTSFLNNKDLPA